MSPTAGLRAIPPSATKSEMDSPNVCIRSVPMGKRSCRGRPVTGCRTTTGRCSINLDPSTNPARRPRSAIIWA